MRTDEQWVIREVKKRTVKNILAKKTFPTWSTICDRLQIDANENDSVRLTSPFTITIQDHTHI